MTDRLRMSAPEINEHDERQVADALRSGVLGLGPYAERFERAAPRSRGWSTVSRSAPARRLCT